MSDEDKMMRDKSLTWSEPVIMTSKPLITEYEKLELLHSQLDELINGNQLPIDELKILQSFVGDIREKYFDDNGNLTETNQEFNQALDFKINKWGF